MQFYLCKFSLEIVERNLTLNGPNESAQFTSLRSFIIQKFVTGLLIDYLAARIIERIESYLRCCVNDT